MTEFGSMSAGGDVDVRNLAYASLLGTFADHGGEILTAWDWYPGMWEVLHLFSRSAHGTRVASSSSVDTLVSAYSSLSDAGDSLTVILVNRNPSTAQAVSVTLSGFIPSGDATTLQLSGLKSETFVSGSQNALKHGAVAVVSGSLSLSIPSKSITAIQLVGKGRPVVGRVRKPNGPEAASFSQTGSTLRLSASAGARFDLVSMQGRLLGSTEIKSGSATLSTKGLVRGVYLAKWAEGSKKVVVGN